MEKVPLMCKRRIPIRVLLTFISLGVVAPRVLADPISYNITDLSQRTPIGINDQGQVGLGGAYVYNYGRGVPGYTGYYDYPNTVSIYNSLGPNAGTLTAPNASGPIPGGGNGTTVPWVNDSGESTGVDPPNAYVSIGGVQQQIGPTFSGGSQWIDPKAINNAGQVVGEAGFPNTTGYHAFLYSAGQTIDLGTLGGTLSIATAINSSGVVVGLSETAITQLNPDGPVHAFVYQNGVMTDLTSALGNSWSQAYGVNSTGVIVGDMSSNFYGPGTRSCSTTAS